MKRKSLYQVLLERWPHGINEHDHEYIEKDVSWYLLLGYTIEQCVEAALIFYNKNPKYDDDPAACFNYGMEEYLETEAIE